MARPTQRGDGDLDALAEFVANLRAKQPEVAAEHDVAMEMLGTTPGILAMCATTMREVADDLEALAEWSDRGRLAAASEAVNEHFHPALKKRVGQPVQESELGKLSAEQWAEYGGLAGLRALAQASRSAQFATRLLLTRLNHDYGTSAARSSEAAGISNATASKWLREPLDLAPDAASTRQG